MKTEVTPTPTILTTHMRHMEVENHPNPLDGSVSVNVPENPPLLNPMKNPNPNTGTSECSYLNQIYLILIAIERLGWKRMRVSPQNIKNILFLRVSSHTSKNPTTSKNPITSKNLITKSLCHLPQRNGSDFEIGKHQLQRSQKSPKKKRKDFLTDSTAS